MNFIFGSSGYFMVARKFHFKDEKQTMQRQNDCRYFYRLKGCFHPLQNACCQEDCPDDTINIFFKKP
jgi:hypothetical protein